MNGFSVKTATVISSLFLLLHSSISFSASGPCEEILSATKYEDVRSKTEELLKRHRNWLVDTQTLIEFRASEIVARTLFFEGDTDGVLLLNKLDARLRDAIGSDENEPGALVPEIQSLLEKGTLLVKGAENSTDRDQARKASQALVDFRAEIDTRIKAISVSGPQSMDFQVLTELEGTLNCALAQLAINNPPLTVAPEDLAPGTPVVSGVHIGVSLMPDPRSKPGYWNPPRYPKGYDGRSGIRFCF